MLLTPDLSKFGRPATLHIALHAIDLFVQSHSHLPRLHNSGDVDAVVAIANEFVTANSESLGTGWQSGLLP